MAKMHVAWVRSDFPWPLIEFQHGRFDWAMTDQVVKEASARRMNVLAVLSHTPDWARGPGTTTENPPDRITDFTEFARAAAARYAPLGVHTWEIWNGPRTAASSGSPPPTRTNTASSSMRPPRRYARSTQRDASRRRADSRHRLSRWLANLSNDVSQAAVCPRNRAIGGCDRRYPYFPLLPTETKAVVVGGINEMPALHRLMERHGDGAKKLWITEFGAPTGTSRVAVSEQDQVTTILEARKLVAKWPWAGPLIIDELRDGGTNPAVDSENFGMVRRNFTLKPAAKALMAQRIAP